MELKDILVCLLRNECCDHERKQADRYVLPGEETRPIAISRVLEKETRMLNAYSHTWVISHLNIFTLEYSHT